MAILRIRWRKARKALRLPDLNSYPATPQGYYEGWYPGSALARSFRSKFDTEVQRLPELNVYPATPSQELYPATQLAVSFRVEFDVRRQQTPELNEYPATPAAPYAATVLARSLRFGFDITPQRPLELNTFPSTPQGYYEGWFPGSRGVEALRSSFEVTRQELPQLDEYPATPAVEATLPSFIPPPSFRRRTTRFTALRALIAPVFPATSAAYYTGYYPASNAPIRAIRSFHRRRHLSEIPVRSEESASITATPFSNKRHIAPFVN